MTDEMASQTRTNNGTDLALPDIVERLRETKVDHDRDCLPYGECYCWFDLCYDAADEIVRLRALITECAEAVKGLNDAGMGDGRVPRFLDAFDALREEANR